MGWQGTFRIRIKAGPTRHLWRDNVGTACGRVPSSVKVTTDAKQVTCGSCKRTKGYLAIDTTLDTPEGETE